MKTRVLTSGGANLFWVLLVIVGLVLLNLILQRETARIDLTADQRYTLADVTRETAATLPGNVRVELFFSANLPPPLEQARRELNDLLEEYRTHSDGKLTYQFVDPDASESDRERAGALNIPSWPLEQSSENELSVRNVYTGIALVYDDGEEEHTEVIQQVRENGNYEYQLTRALRALVREGGPSTIGVAFNDGGLFDPLLNQPMDPSNPMGPEQVQEEFANQLEEVFEHQYEFQFVDMAAPGPIPDNVSGLFLMGPTGSFTDDMKYKLDQFIMAGHPVAFFISPYKMEALQFDQPQMQGMTVPAQNDTGLDALLETYGVRLNRDAVVDFEHAQVSAERQEGMVMGYQAVSWVPYLDARLPEVPNIDQNSVLTPNMGLVAFLPLDRGRPLSQSTLSPTAQAVEAQAANTLTLGLVIQSSDTSYRLDGEGLEVVEDADLAPFIAAIQENQESPDIDLPRGPFPVAVTLEGTFNSAFEAPPEGVVADGSFPDHMGTTDQGRIFVVANGYWVQALFMGQDPLMSRQTMMMLPAQVRNTIQLYRASNFMLLQNTTDWLAQESELVRIRARGIISFLDVSKLDAGDKQFYQIFNIAGLPMIFVLLGLGGFLVRQFRRSSISDDFSRTDKRS